MLSWQNPANGRRYAARLERDLFGEIVLVVAFHGAYARKGRIMTIPLNGALPTKAIRALRKRRKRHGYVPCNKLHLQTNGHEGHRLKPRG